MNEDQRLMAIEHQVSSHDQRIQALEKLSVAQTTDKAVRELRDEHLDKRFDKIEDDVGEIKGYLLKIVWLIVLSLIGALVTFIVQGGLAGGP